MMKEGNCIVNHEETNILFVEDDATICKSLPPILETYDRPFWRHMDIK